MISNAPGNRPEATISDTVSPAFSRERIWNLPPDPTCQLWTSVTRNFRNELPGVKFLPNPGSHSQNYLSLTGYHVLLKSKSVMTKKAPELRLPDASPAESVLNVCPAYLPAVKTPSIMIWWDQKVNLISERLFLLRDTRPIRLSFPQNMALGDSPMYYRPCNMNVCSLPADLPAGMLGDHRTKPVQNALPSCSV